MTPNDKIRLFVAVSVPFEQRETIARAIDPLKENLRGARWIDPENQHVTLKFLGWVPETSRDAISSICTGVAAAHPRTEIALTDIGAFPNERRPRVLWVGIDDPSHVLEGLARDLDESFEGLGIAREDRPYTPHLTLARFKLPVKGHGELPQLGLDLPAFVVDRIELFRSILSPKGARYESIEEFALA